jgi:hypothetical protein
MAGEDSKPERKGFRIGGNTFHDRKNKIPMKILEFKRSGIGLIVEFRGIPNGFPNQASHPLFDGPNHLLDLTHMLLG